MSHDYLNFPFWCLVSSWFQISYRRVWTRDRDQGCRDLPILPAPWQGYLWYAVQLEDHSWDLFLFYHHHTPQPSQSSRQMWIRQYHLDSRRDLCHHCIWKRGSSLLGCCLLMCLPWRGHWSGCVDIQSRNHWSDEGWKWSIIIIIHNRDVKQDWELLIQKFTH